MGGADGADEAIEAAGGADGIFSWGGALGQAPEFPLVCVYRAANCSCIDAYCSTEANNFCRRYKLCIPICKKRMILKVKQNCQQKNQLLLTHSLDKLEYLPRKALCRS